MKIVSKYFYDYLLPTEQPFHEALKEYRRRMIVTSVAIAIAVATALLLALAIVAVQSGYWYIVAIVLLILLGGRGGGGAPAGGAPPSGPGNTGTQKASDKAEPAQGAREVVLVPAYRPRPKMKMFAVRPEDPDGPPVVIEREVDGG